MKLSSTILKTRLSYCVALPFFLLGSTLFLLNSCSKSKEIEINPEDTYSYEVDCNNCDISYVDSENVKKTINNNNGKWEYIFKNKINFELKIEIKTNSISMQTIHVYILKNKEVIFGDLAYNTANVTYNTLQNTGRSAYGTYRADGSSGTSSGNGTKPKSSVCGAKNKTGGYCKRLVSGGGRCWQH